MRIPTHIAVALPRGPEHYWKEMRARNARGFTVQDIALSSEGVSNTTVKRYIWWLEKQGYVVKVGSKKDGYAIANIYKIKRDSRTAPIERAEDKGKPATARQALWTAMRTLPQFGVAELTACASTEERPIARRSAELYVQKLVSAGVLEMLEAPKRANGWPRGARGGLYRLKPTANVGPLAPKLCKADFVFDPNKNRVLGEAVVTEPRS
ncbi:hypothetical protein [Methylosinus sp. Sm6]|uniref:hypothetical protein n=1 Tax=Methylosinus sp. Sm6 TaxID=2866948 RepID=UPI001C99E0DD|nr:hypothetical protein [Methylosinus sp. Sm6]MBY6244112.1 hypothetical protein [Methylosinus sp. Sm6]